MFLLQYNVGGIALNPYNILQIVVTLLFGFLIFAWKIPVFDIIKQHPIRFYAYLYIYGLFSVFWSVMPAASGFFALQNLVFVTLFFVLAANAQNKQHVEKLFLQFNIIVMLAFFYRNFGYWHSVTFSTLAACILTYSLGEMHFSGNREHLNWCRVAIAVGAIGLILTTSSGAMVSVACGIATLGLTSKHKGIRVLAILTILFGLMLVFLGQTDKVIAFLFPGKTMVSIQTAHGRTVIWDMIFHLAKQKPWLGWGYASIERILPLYCTDSHNSMVGCIGSQGYIGVFLLSIAMLTQLLYIVKNIAIPGFRGLLPATVCLLVNANTSGFLNSTTNFQALIFFQILAMSVVFKHNATYGQSQT
jgi:O-antigen ligase